jgi:hypothetical protein
MKLINAHCGRNAELLVVNAGVIYNTTGFRSVDL